MDRTTPARLRLPAILSLLALAVWALPDGVRAQMEGQGRVLPYEPYGPRSVRAQLAESLRLLGLDRVHRELGIRGAGVGVLVIDDWTFRPERGYVHGQAVAETIRGAAPEATLWFCRLDFAQAGPQELADCLNDVLLQDLPVRVVNLSFASGDGLYGEPCGFLAQDPRNPLARAIRALYERGVIFVAASGNDGFKRGLRFPACLPEVLSVGATYDFTGEAVFRSEQVSCADRAAPDRVTCYSDVAPYLDVVAPGTVVSTPSAPDFGGTSAAAPLVSGVAALLLSAQSRLTAPEVVRVLRSTGVPAFDPRANAYFPRVDAYRALQAVLSPFPAPPAGLGAFDANGNGLIDDSEFFAAVDAWIGGSLPDGAFFALIDAWVARAPVRGTASPSPPPLSLHGLRLENADTIWIYDARGRRLAAISRPRLPQLQRLLRRRANGVYLYVIQESDSEGHRVRTVGKLVVLR